MKRQSQETRPRPAEIRAADVAKLGERIALLSIDALAPGSVAGWAAYPAGVAWALREAGHLAGGADVAIDADLPVGAGLSSSAALACSVALALTGLYRRPVPRRELAALARRAENDFAGVPSGIMDQLAALLCRAGHALLLDCRTGAGTAVPLDPAGAGLALLVIDTRVRHALADGRYAARRQSCADAAALLGVRALRDVTGDPGAPARLAEPNTAPLSFASYSVDLSICAELRSAPVRSARSSRARRRSAPASFARAARTRPCVHPSSRLGSSPPRASRQSSDPRV